LPHEARFAAAIAAVALALAGTFLVGCGVLKPSTDPAAGSALRETVPDGFRLSAVTHAPVPSFEPLMSGRTEPVTMTVAVYRSDDAPQRAITATLATYADEVGALAAYNGWFARNAFMAAVERNALDLGDQSECFNVEWPAFHAVTARQGGLFVLVEADTAVPIEACRALMAKLLEAANS